MTPLANVDCVIFIANNCAKCIHYQSHRGALIECGASHSGAKLDILQWKQNQGDDPNKWTCAAKINKHGI